MLSSPFVNSSQSPGRNMYVGRQVRQCVVGGRSLTGILESHCRVADVGVCYSTAGSAVFEWRRAVYSR